MIKKYIWLFLLLIIIGCGGGSSDGVFYDRETEMASMRNLVAQYRPDILEMEGYAQITAFRDHIHWVTLIRADPLYLPFYANVYKETVQGERGHSCQGMTINVCAFLQTYGYRFRMVELWTLDSTPTGVPITHSVFEVWIDDQWEMHDTTYNLVFEYSGEILDTEGIQGLLREGEMPVPFHQGCEGRPGYDEIPEMYADYFNEIRYSFTEVFFLPR